MLKEAEVKVLVLKPCELQVSINVSAVRVSVPGDKTLHVCTIVFSQIFKGQKNLLVSERLCMLVREGASPLAVVGFHWVPLGWVLEGGCWRVGGQNPSKQSLW